MSAMTGSCAWVRAWLVLCLAGCAARGPASAASIHAGYYTANTDSVAAAPPDVASFLEETADARGFELKPDARLADIARLWAARAARAARAGGLTPSQLELALRRHGIYDARYSVITQPVPAHIARSGLANALEDALRAHGITHYGAAWGEQRGVRVLTVLLSARRIVLAPLPNSVPLHAKLHLRGHALDTFRNLRVEVLTGTGRALIPVASEREISVQLTASERGLQRIELRGEGAKGVETLAKLPVYVDQSFPTQPAGVRADGPRDVAAIAQRVVESINRERAKAGLAPLQRDARLDGLAHAHSADMRDHDFVDHASARTGDAVQRVAQAGLPTLLVLESVARAPNPAALEASAATPAHELGNMLSKHITHVGVGIALQHDAYGELWIATQLFAELPERLDVASAAPRLLGLLNEARVARAAPTVALDQGLSSVAVRAAEHFVSDPDATERTILAQTDKELGRFALSYRRVNALLALTPRLQDAASLEPALDPDASGIGIGIAQGTKAGAAVVAVVMILGTRR